MALARRLAPTGLPRLTACLRLAASLRQLVIEKLPSDATFDLAVRDGKTGFTFFNVEGHGYDYDADSRLFSITNGRLLISPEFANELGFSSEDRSVGTFAFTASMQAIETKTIVDGEVQSAVLPAFIGHLDLTLERCQDRM